MTTQAFTSHYTVKIKDKLSSNNTANAVVADACVFPLSFEGSTLRWPGSNVFAGGGSRLPDRGNTNIRQRDSGYWWVHFQRGGRTLSRDKPTHAMELSCEQTMGSWAVCEPALEPLCEWEGLRTRCQDFKPDLGNSAVEHDQGGLRKRSHGGNENPTRKRKSELGNLHLQPARRSSL